jgi:hypothetical protein
MRKRVVILCLRLEIPETRIIDIGTGTPTDGEKTPRFIDYIDSIPIIITRSIYADFDVPTEMSAYAEEGYLIR